MRYRIRVATPDEFKDGKQIGWTAWGYGIAIADDHHGYHYSTDGVAVELEFYEDDLNASYLGREWPDLASFIEEKSK